MERFNTYVSPADAALEQTPEVLKTIRMNTTVHIFDSVIYNFVGVFGSQSFIGEKRIGVESRTRFHMLFDFRLKGGRANLAATLKDAHDGGFVFGSGSGNTALLDAQMHVASFAADGSLVRFHFA